MTEEALITKVYISKVGELHVGFKVKAGDYLMSEALDLITKWQDGIPQKVSLENYQDEVPSPDHNGDSELPTH